MENATDAIKMAFAIFMFVISLTILFMAVARTKITADTLYYYADKTNFYQHAKSVKENRTVTAPDIVSTIYKYDTESIAVRVILQDGTEYKFDLYGNEQTDEEKRQIKEDITTCINNLADKEFKEEFVEVPISGIYLPTVDGTEITLAKGAKKVYITYREIALT